MLGLRYLSSFHRLGCIIKMVVRFQMRKEENYYGFLCAQSRLGNCKRSSTSRMAGKWEAPNSSNYPAYFYNPSYQ